MIFRNYSAHRISQFGNVDPNYIMDDVACIGNETSLFDCPHATSHDCGASEPAGVVCTGNNVISIYNKYISIH